MIKSSVNTNYVFVSTTAEQIDYLNAELVRLRELLQSVCDHSCGFEPPDDGGYKDKGSCYICGIAEYRAPI